MAKVKRTIYHEGKKYRLSKMAWPKGGVKRQYREARRKHAGHMYEYHDGRRVVDHVDLHNPTYGAKGFVLHGIFDVLGVGGTLAVGVGAAIAIAMAWRAAKKTDKKLEAVKDDIKKTVVENAPQSQPIAERPEEEP